MLEQAHAVAVQWRAGATPHADVRARVERELQPLWWSLNQMQALALDAHHSAGGEHAFLMPRIELSLPLYDLNLRFRMVVHCLDELCIRLHQGERHVADLRLV